MDHTTLTDFGAAYEYDNAFVAPTDSGVRDDVVRRLGELGGPGQAQACRSGRDQTGSERHTQDPDEFPCRAGHAAP